MNGGKVKYYFRKPKGEIIKDILLWLALAGGMVVMGNVSPIRLFLRSPYSKHYKQQSMRNAFVRLKKQGALSVEKRGHNYSISLTEQGRKKAGWLQIDLLKISKPKKWDQKWRFLLFDIEQEERWRRDVLRSFLVRLGFVLFQKSVWVHPYDCRAELELLREFIGLDTKRLKFIETNEIGPDTQQLKKKFHLL